MSRAKKKTKRAGFVGSVADPLARIGGRILRLAVSGFLAAVVGGVLCAGAYLTWRRYGGPRLVERPEYRVALGAIEITPPPPWVGSKLCQEVQQLAGLPDSLLLLDRQVLEEVAQAFSLHPWVATVVRASKAYPGTMRVELVYRTPVAMIDVVDGLFPVDVEGVLLPSSAFSATEARLYPRVQGIRSRPAGTAGMSWGDPSVTGAAKIVAALEEDWERLNLDAIEVIKWTVGDQAETEIFYLLSKGGTRVVWGRPPGGDHPGELSPEEKLTRLNRYISEHGSLEAPAGPYEFDIRHWESISLRPRTRS